MTDNDSRDKRLTNPLDAIPLGGAPGAELIHIESPADGAGLTERAENAIELKEIEGLSQAKIIRRRFLHHRGAMIALVVLIALLLLAYTSEGFRIFGLQVPGWWKFQYGDIANLQNNAHPTMGWFHLGSHPFGQDDVGHDIFAESMRGIQQSIMIIVVIGVVSTLIGVVMGAIAGYFGGIIDSILMRMTDLFIIVPVIVLAAVIGRFANGSGSFILALLLGLLLWTNLARLVRGEVLTLRSREFVEAAKVAGASHWRIIFKHILPNAAGVIIVSMTLTMSAAILLEAALGYLGLGVQPPDISLGSMISQYEGSFSTRPWLFWYTGTFILVIALTVNFIGDGLRDAFDPRQKRKLDRKAKALANGSRGEVPAAAEKGTGR